MLTLEEGLGNMAAYYNTINGMEATVANGVLIIKASHCVYDTLDYDYDLDGSNPVLDVNFTWEKQTLSSYRFGFNGQEKDNEVKGTGNSYDFGARIYDSRLGRWMSTDPLMPKYPYVSPYNFALNSPLVFVDKNGMEPDKNGAVGLSAYISKITAWTLNGSRSDILSYLFNFYGGFLNTSGSGNSESDKFRFVYSTRWGWIDLKHFGTAAYHTDNPFITGNYVLERGEKLERDQEKKGNASGYSYEDLTSNLLGVYFEQYIEDFVAETDYDKEQYLLKGQAYILEKFFKEIGVVDDPTSAPNYNSLPENYEQSSKNPGKKDKTYTPSYTTEKRDKDIDKSIMERLEDFKKSKMKKR